MGNAGDSLSFVKAYLGHKCSGRNQKNPVPDTTKHLRQDIGSKGGGCTAAAGTWCSILLVLVSVLLTGFGIYPLIAKWGGAGALVPITGFANGIRPE